MAINSTPIISGSIDQALEEQLRKRGMTNKISELKTLESQSRNVVTDTLKGTVKQVGELTVLPVLKAVKDLGEGVGAGIASLTTNKYQDEATKAGLEQHAIVLKQLQNNNLGNREKQRLAKLSTQTDKSLAEQIPELQKSTKDIYGGAAQLALLATMGLSPALTEAGASGKLITSESANAIKSLYNQTKAMAAAERVSRFGKIGELANVVADKGTTALKGLVGTTVFFTPEEMKKREVKYDDTLAKELEKRGMGYKVEKTREPGFEEAVSQAAGMGAAFEAAPLAIGLYAKALGFLGSSAKKGLSEEIGDRVINKLKSYAEGTTYAERVAGASNVTDRLLSKVEPNKTTGQKIAGGVLDLGESVSQLPAKITDRFAPLSKIEEQARLKKGTPLTEDERAYLLARTRSSAQGKAEERFVQMKDELVNPYKDIENDVKARMVALDDIDRLKRENVITGGKQMEQAEADLADHIKQSSDKGIEERIQQAILEKNRLNNEVLDDMLEAGLIDDRQLKNLRETHPNYIPHKVVLDEIDNAMARGTGSINVSETGIKKAKGSERTIYDPYEAMVERFPKLYEKIENNKAVGALVNAQERYGVVNGMKKITGEMKVKPDEETINFFRNGQRETWVVPKDIAIAVKNLDYERNSAIIRFLSAPAKVLRAFATQYNLPFSVQNLARDKQTYAVTAESFVQQMAKEAGVTPKQIGLNKQELESLYKRSGGIGGTVYNEGKNAEKLISGMKDNGFASSFANDARPDRIISNINSAFEQDTRLATFRKGLEAGLSPREAALAARDATVDFDKMGTIMRSVNQVIPFLNARMQGAINIGRAAKQNPEAFARTLTYTGVYPTLALYQHNRQFESFKNIPQNINDNYWVIMTGEVDGRDSNGDAIKIPQFVTVKKGEAQQLVSIPTEHYLRKMDDISYRDTNKMLAATLGNFSPISVGSFDSQNFWLSAASQLGPVASIPVGLGTNINPFSGQNIVPTSRVGASPELQYQKTTPENIKELGALTGISPAKINFVLNSFGGVPGQVVGIANELELAAEGGKKPKSLSGTTFGEVSKLPFMSSFIRESGEAGSPKTQLEMEEKKKLGVPIIDRKIKNQEKADEILDNLSKIKNKEEKIKYLDSQFMSPEVKDMVKSRGMARKTSGVLSSNDSAELRASVIYKDLMKMGEEGLSKEAKVEYLDNLKKAKIITPEVKSQVAGLVAYTKNIDAVRATAPEARAQIIYGTIESLKKENVPAKLIGQYLTRLADEGLIDATIKQQMIDIKNSSK